LGDDSNISFVHPLKTQPIKLDVQGKSVIASPYKKRREGNDTDSAQLDDIKKIHQQAT